MPDRDGFLFVEVSSRHQQRSVRDSGCTRPGEIRRAFSRSTGSPSARKRPAAELALPALLFSPSPAQLVVFSVVDEPSLATMMMASISCLGPGKQQKKTLQGKRIEETNSTGSLTSATSPNRADPGLRKGVDELVELRPGVSPPSHSLPVAASSTRPRISQYTRRTRSLYTVRGQGPLPQRLTTAPRSSYCVCG